MSAVAAKSATTDGRFVSEMSSVSSVSGLSVVAVGKFGSKGGNGKSSLQSIVASRQSNARTNTSRQEAKGYRERQAMMAILSQRRMGGLLLQCLQQKAVYSRQSLVQCKGESPIHSKRTKCGTSGKCGKCSTGGTGWCAG